MEIDSIQQQHTAYPTINLNAINHQLESVVNYQKPQLNLSVLLAEFFELTQDFLDIFPDAKLDMIRSTDSTCFIFYQFHQQSHHQHCPLEELKQRVVAMASHWQILEIISLPLNQINNAICNQHITTMVAEISTQAMLPSPSLVTAFTRPYPGLSANGDGFYYYHTNNEILACVIDGLGHGEPAEEAQRIALATVKQHRQEALNVILAHSHTALRKTRGVAMTLARISFDDNRITHAGIGNVELRLQPRQNHFIPKAGVLGMGQQPNIQVTHSPWNSDSLMVIYSDGVSGKYSLLPLQQHSLSSRFLSHFLVRGFERDNDDATVLIVRGS